VKHKFLTTNQLTRRLTDDNI